jgi:cold shock CspA family protein
MTAMSSPSKLIVCQRCGRGVILTKTYRDLLERKKAKVVDPVLCPTCFLADGPLSKQYGRVKWFNPHKHYGFIVADRGEDVSFHESQLLDDTGHRLQTGQRVRFHLHQAVKGLEALNVELSEPQDRSAMV